MNKTQFFLLCAGLGAVASVVTWLFERPLRPILEAKAQPEIASAERAAE
jgi:hypothetical protein